MALGLWVAAYALTAVAATLLLSPVRRGWGVQALLLALQTAILAYLFDVGWAIHDSTAGGLSAAEFRALPNRRTLPLLPLAGSGILLAYLGRDSLRAAGKAAWLSLALSWTGTIFGVYSFTIFVMTPLRSWPDWKLIASVLSP